MVSMVCLGTSVLLQRKRCCVVLMLVECSARLIGVYCEGKRGSVDVCCVSVESSCVEL